MLGLQVKDALAGSFDEATVAALSATLGRDIPVNAAYLVRPDNHAPAAALLGCVCGNLAAWRGVKIIGGGEQALALHITAHAHTSAAGGAAGINHSLRMKGDLFAGNLNASAAST